MKFPEENEYSLQHLGLISTRSLEWILIPVGAVTILVIQASIYNSTMF